MSSPQNLWSTLPAVLSGEELPMTLQVALIGSEGVVIASDRLGVSPPTGRNTVDASSLVSKIEWEKNFVCTFAGDDCVCRIAQRLANNIRKTTIFSDSSVFIKAVNDLLETHKIDWFCKSSQSRKIIWSQTDGQNLRLWSATFDADTFVLVENENWIVAGHQGNPARYWIDHYYRQNEGQKKSTKGLKKLAAHMILTAKSLNTAAIEDLELVVGTAKGGFDKIKPSELDDLRKISEGIHEANTKLFQ
jgi:20S proteasome alpha/beta subunit